MADNPNCAETYATFRLLGPQICPDRLTRALGMLPTFQAVAGEAVPPADHRRTNGLWAISTKDLLISTDLEKHIITLLDKLPVGFQDHVPQGSICEIFCFWQSSIGHGGPILSSSLLAKLGKAGIDLDFDFYSVV